MNWKKMMNNEFKWGWKEAVVAQLSCYASICLEGLKANTAKLSQGSRYSSIDPN
jgi:hypothetical protein